MVSVIVVGGEAGVLSDQVRLHQIEDLIRFTNMNSICPGEPLMD